MENLEDFKKEFDRVLEAHFDKKASEFLKENKNAEFADWLHHTKKILMSGGKRIRPYLAYTAFSLQHLAYSKEKNTILELLVSLELFHLFALIHDDIIDNGKIRHGVLTLHEYINETQIANRKSQNNNANLKNYDNSQAMLVGDLIFSWSQELLATNETFEPARLQKAKQYYYKMVADTMRGQMIDVSLTIKLQVKDEIIFEKMLLKTARYTFVYSLQIGATLANVGQSVIDFYQKFGEALGIGFQIQDDLLDVTNFKFQISNFKLPIKNEKTIFADISSGQHTLLTNYIFEHGTKEQKETLKKYFGKPVVASDCKKLAMLLKNSGAIDFAKNLSNKFFSEATELIQKSTFTDSEKETLQALVRYIQEREN